MNWKKKIEAVYRIIRLWLPRTFFAARIIRVRHFYRWIVQLRQCMLLTGLSITRRPVRR
jgi:hypothetical protein